MPYNGYIDVPDMNLDPDAINMTDPGYQAYRRGAAKQFASTGTNVSESNPLSVNGDIDSQGNVNAPPDAPLPRGSYASRAAQRIVGSGDSSAPPAASPDYPKAMQSAAQSAVSDDTSQDPDAGLEGVDANPYVGQAAKQLAAPPGAAAPTGGQAPLPNRNNLPAGVNFQYMPRQSGLAPGPNGVVATIGDKGYYTMPDGKKVSADQAAIGASISPQTQALYDQQAAIAAARVQPHQDYAYNPATGQGFAAAPRVNIPQASWDNTVAGNQQKIANQHELDVISAKNSGAVALAHEQYSAPVLAANEAAKWKAKWDAEHGGEGSPEAMGHQQQLNQAEIDQLNAKTDWFKRTVQQETTPDQKQNADSITSMLSSLQHRNTPQANQLQAKIVTMGDPRKVNPAAFQSEFQDAMKPTSDEYLNSGPGQLAFSNFTNWLSQHQGKYRDTDRDASYQMINSMTDDAQRAGVSPSEVQRLQARLVQADMDTVAKRPWKQNWQYGIQEGPYQGPNQPRQLASPETPFLPPSARQQAFPGQNDMNNLFGFGQ